tara:strand:+ start:524 stop:823 length:300 start_codon:yes stop_codon:yes gene_type:complete
MSKTISPPPTYKCCLCDKTEQGYGNDPFPLYGDLCCDNCNYYVIMSRLVVQKKQDNGETITIGCLKKMTRAIRQVYFGDADSVDPELRHLRERLDATTK